ncbi:MAG TPA: gamma carbonic anhydrase family protein [Candidatus Dormibacteraeota bacterium]|nr:gamma carbonic anhydrase family protein [Candidatus Dormibacteraeota bacterium]
MFIEYRGKRPRVARSAFVAPTAVLIGDVEVGEHSSIWFGTVLRADNGPIRVGDRTSIQDNSVIHVSEGTATIIGSDVTVGHCVHMEDCTIEDGSLVGSNSVVLNGAVVGPRSLIGAGSVVGANVKIPPGTVAAGAPASVKKPVEGKASWWLEHAAVEYVELSRSYLHHGIGDPEMHELIEAPAEAEAP